MPRFGFRARPTAPLLRFVTVAFILAICFASAGARAQATGLVASYSFEEGTGTAASDASGNNNNGTLANATWTTSGKFGKALTFNGTSSVVNVPDAASLRLTTAMTLEAWVYPTAAGSVWRTVRDEGSHG